MYFEGTEWSTTTRQNRVGWCLLMAKIASSSKKQTIKFYWVIPKWFRNASSCLSFWQCEGVNTGKPYNTLISAIPCATIKRSQVALINDIYRQLHRRQNPTTIVVLECLYKCKPLLYPIMLGLASSLLVVCRNYDLFRDPSDLHHLCLHDNKSVAKC